MFWLESCECQSDEDSDGNFEETVNCNSEHVAKKDCSELRRPPNSKSFNALLCKSI